MKRVSNIVVLLALCFAIGCKGTTDGGVTGDTETKIYPKPTSGTAQVYSGSEITHNVAGFDALNMTITGDTVGTNVGEYTVTVSLKDSKKTWTDGTKVPVTVTWEIEKATNRWEIEPSIEDWYETYTAKEPNGKAQFGEIMFSYEKDDGTTLETKPTEKGNYKLVVHVTGTNNYTELTKEVVFAIKSPSVGLEYKDNGDGTASVTGIGIFTGTDLVIASTYNGLPVTEISTRAFSSQSALTSVTIPDSVTYLGEYAFSGCTSLTNVKLPNSITYINQYAFQGCTNLADVTIPNSVKKISTGAFAGCTSMQNIFLEEGNTVFQIIDGALIKEGKTVVQFPAGKKAESFSTPDGITRIEHFAFQNNKFVTEIILKDEVTYIGNNAFDGCSGLKSITIPESVLTIGGRAFLKCDSLETVNTPYTKATVPSSWGKDNNEKLFNLLKE